MPIYEYECENCSLRFELRRGFEEERGATCPQCQSVARRIFLPVPVIFKGSGFYVTDSRNNPGRPSDEGKGDKVESGKESENK